MKPVISIFIALCLLSFFVPALNESRPQAVLRDRSNDGCRQRVAHQVDLGKQRGIFVDGRLIDAPIIQSEISDMILIDGDFTNEQAKRVAARLRASRRAR